jgi:hypothetical protein
LAFIGLDGAMLLRMRDLLQILGLEKIAYKMNR